MNFKICNTIALVQDQNSLVVRYFKIWMCPTIVTSILNFSPNDKKNTWLNFYFQ